MTSPARNTPPGRWWSTEHSPQYRDAGFDRLWIHQIGPDQEGFLRFYAEEILPAL
jgi:coenzyme F420-dependent glucose-6-phosphate dehydrogenase